MSREQYVLKKDDLLYDHLVTYCVGLISLSSLHHDEIRKQIIKLPQLTMEGTIHKEIHLPMESFRPWLENLHKASNQKYLVRYTIWLAEKVLSSSYEDVIKHHNDSSPITNFFRHIRNGVSHGNKFNIQISERIRRRDNITDTTTLASWHDKKIKLTLQGTVVVPDYITLGDIFVLMHDMNEHLMQRS